MDVIYKVLEVADKVIYAMLAVTALFGVFTVIMVTRRIAQKRFSRAAQADSFLEEVRDNLRAGNTEAVVALCDSPGYWSKAVPNLVHLAIENLDRPANKVRRLMAERFETDVLADLEYRLSWVNTVIKSAPMLGLLGTVVGMMGAFLTLSTNENVDPTQLAGDINVALRTTACGLAIAIPLIIMMASVNVRLRKMEDLISSGLTRFLDSYKQALTRRVRRK